MEFLPHATVVFVLHARTSLCVQAKSRQPNVEERRYGQSTTATSYSIGIDVPLIAT